MDLSVLVRPLPQNQSAIYSQALQLLDTMQSSPSCHRLATSTLLNSCQDIEGSTHATETSLDDIRSIYAARLALCEISGAGLNLPRDCKPLKLIDVEPDLRGPRRVIDESNVRPGTFKVESDQIRQCLHSLESRPQWWTSYSNNRQSAAVMCQAARIDIEKGLFYPT